MDFRWIAGITIWTMLVGPAFVGLNHWPTRAPARATSPPNYDSRRVSMAPECPLTSAPTWLNTSARSVTSACVCASPVSNSREEPDE
jgi:hypothetical protein